MRKLFFWLVTGSFVAEIAISELWLRHSRGSSILDLLSDAPAWPAALGLGALLGVAIALASRALFATIAPGLIRDVFIPAFSHARYPDILLMSILPGIGEEILFRGVIQPAAGIIPASLIFGFIHSGFSIRLLPYGIWAAAVGAALGLLYIFTGNLWGSISAHALINAMGGLWIMRMARRE